MTHEIAAEDGAPPLLPVPPRPKKRLPSLAMLRTAASNTLAIFDERLFDDLVVIRRYGPVSVAFVSDPAGIRQILVDNFANYPRLAVIRRLFAAEIRTGTLATSGEIWARHRRVAGPTLDRRALAPELPALMALTEAAAEAFDDGLAGERFNIQDRMSRLWLHGLNSIVTGGDPAALPILRWLSKVPRKPQAIDLLPMPDWLRDRISPARQSPERALLRDQLRDMIVDRQKDGYRGGRDLLWRLAHAVDRQTGRTLPLDEVTDEASSQLSAGEASVSALTWIWYLLALHPRVEARLHAELDAVLGHDELRPEHLKALVYTRQVLDEVIRLYPPIPLIVRQARRSDVVAGHRIPRNAIVVVAPFVVHRHRKLWTEPERFDPDRFGAQDRAGRPSLSYIPFSAGPGNCPGTVLATQQLTIVLAALARRYRFRLASDDPVRPFGAISLKPRGGLWVTAERRRAPGDR